MKKTFFIDYRLMDNEGFILKEGKFKVKNKISKFDAQCSFEDYLKKKHPNFGKLIINSCFEDFLGFGDWFSKL